MKDFKKNQKKPRGAAVDSRRESLRQFALDSCFKGGVSLSSIADHLFTLGEDELGAIARRIRRDLGKLEGRVRAIDTMKPPTT